MTENLTRMCPHCDAALPDGAKYCANCGAFVAGDGESTFESAKTFVMNSAAGAKPMAREMSQASRILGAPSKKMMLSVPFSATANDQAARLRRSA